MNREEIYFTVAGVEPGPQGSKKHVGNGIMVESSKKVAPFRKAVAEAIFRTYVATGDDRIFTEPVVLWATFYLPKPKSVKRLFPSVAPDLDKLCRSLLDACDTNAGLLENDSLVVKIHAAKVYASTPEDIGVRVAIRTVKAVDNDSVTETHKLRFEDESE